MKPLVMHRLAGVGVVRLKSNGQNESGKTGDRCIAKGCPGHILEVSRLPAGRTRMGKKAKPKNDELKIERPKRAKLTREESLKRVSEFAKRRERFIAIIRKGKGRGVYP